MTELDDRLAAREKTLQGDLEGRLAIREKELSKSSGGPTSAFSDAIGTAFINEFVLGFPNFAGKVVSQGVAGTEAALEGGASVLTGGDFDFERRAQRNLGEFPLAQLNAIPKPTLAELGAGIHSVPGLFEREGKIKERFATSLQETEARQEQQKEEHPFATKAGEVGADVAAIFAGRAPFLSSIKNAETFLAGKKFANAIKNPTAAGEFGNIVKGALDSKFMRKLMRGAGRATETGVEAAVLEAISGDDPLRTAAYAAGGQAVGSVLLNISHGVGSGGLIKGGLKFATLGAAYTAVIQMLKSTTPGGENNLLESGEKAFSHLVMLMLAGGVATAAGTGRLRGTAFSSKYPIVAETFSTLPRATMLSFLSDYVEASPDEQQTIDATLSQIQQDPEFFGPEITQRLNDALEGGTLVEALRESL